MPKRPNAWRRALACPFCSALLGLLFFGVAIPLKGYNWEQSPGFRRQKLSLQHPGKTGFTLLPGQSTGITFSNSIAEQRLLGSQILPSGSGVAAGDVDADGKCDLYFCSLGSGDRLYRNLGDWRFEDITRAAGLVHPPLDSTGAALVDVDGNGSLDLLVNSIGGGTRLFLNNSKGQFSQSNQGLNPGRAGMSMALADADGDGLLDLYIANYRVSTVMDAPNTRFGIRNVDGRLTVAFINGKPITDPEWTNRFIFHISTGAGSGKFSYDELGEADVFYRNLGRGRFEQVPFTGGAFVDADEKPLTNPPFDWGLTVVMRDFDGDGKPDIYVCNDFTTPDRLWLNDGKGHFRAADRLALRQQPLSSMSLDVADVNRDGCYDLLVVDMLSREHTRRLVQRNNVRPEPLPLGAIDNCPQYPRNMFYLGRGDGTYCETAQFFALEASEWSWAPMFVDIDLDGYEDLLVTNGFERDNMNLDAVEAYDRAGAMEKDSPLKKIQLRRMFPRLATANLAFRNLQGAGFVEAGREWGFDTHAISQGSCLADLDNDGDLDVIVNNLNEMAGVYRNDGSHPRVAVRLKGLGPNTQGIGARIRVTCADLPPQMQEVLAGGRYLSSDDPMRVFAASSLTSRLRIEVDWRSGKRSVIAQADPNCLYEVDEAVSETIPPPTPAPARPLFEDASALLGHSHSEEAFDDFARQSALPKKLSQLGPGVCWGDVNGDGREDLAIASGRGGKLALFLNDASAQFRPSSAGLCNQPADRDQTSVLALPGGAGATLLVGSANYEDAQVTGPAVISCEMPGGKITTAALGMPWSTGPISAADIDGDGNLELFVGGRVKAGQYPVPVSSLILRRQNGGFVVDAPNTSALEKAGMVSGAVWSDLDGDGFPELLLACEWGPLRIFRNNRGRLTASDYALADVPQCRPGFKRPVPAPRLSALTGWWNGVATVDLDGDGRLDIVGANWGQNSKYECSRSAPLRLYYGDWNEDGSTALLETHFEPGMGKYVSERRLDNMGPSMPFLRARFQSYQSFAEAGVEAILGDRLARSSYLEAVWLESSVFLNRGEKLDCRVLPQDAQFAPAFAVVAGDYDGDGGEDIFLSQNFFAVELETSRYDGGRGLWLRGDSKGGLKPVTAKESGIRIYGDQRGAAAADFDADGRLDLVVAQNAAETKLFRNTRAKPGLRVRLQGPPGNPGGIGAQLRLGFGERMGPVREIQAGSGYWSQNSPVQVMGTPEPPTRIWVRWPGGKTTMLDLPLDAREVRVGIQGTIQKLK